AVSFSFLGFGFAWYLWQGVFPLPRIAYLLAGTFCAALLVGSRLWLTLWKKATSHEPAAHFSATPQDGKILVIGGAGDIGSALLRKLIDHGYRVRLLDTLLYGTEPIHDLVENANLELIQGDFRDVGKVLEATRGV